MITAVKPVWTGKDFKIEVHRDVHSLGTAAQQGFLVYDDPVRTLVGIREGRLVPSWGDRKRAAVVSFLEMEVSKVS